MNADPAEGQPTTVPDTTTAETVPPETPDTADTPEPGNEGAAAESSAPENDAAGADDDEADDEADDDAEADDAEAAEADYAELEVAAAESESELEPEAEPEPEPEPVPAKKAAKPKKAAAKATPTPPAASTPLVANRYRLVSEIGGGAMGVVWRARDEILGRDVAVKELRPDHGMSGAQVRTSHQRARREGRIAARLQHPNAVVIYDVAEHEGRPYLIMEYVPSQSLGDILATGTVLTPTEVTSIGAQLASALTAAHERGIVHRDIKPGNVLMTTDGTVKLTDFGISRATGDATVTATGEILGTPAYTAPEVAQGHPVAFPADVFSLGATLYAAVEGIPPFGEDANAMATLLRVVRNEIRPPKRSGPLTDTIMRMLNPEPVDRPTMKQVWLGLDALSGKPLPAIGLPVPPPQTKAFAAPTPTLVVPDPVLNSPATGSRPATAPPRPEPEPRPQPQSQPAKAEAAPEVSPAPNPTPTSGLGPVAATTGMVPTPSPTSAMAPTPAPSSRKTREPVPAVATPPVGTPPPASKSPAAVEPAPPPARRSRSRMPLAITVCVIGTAVLIVAIVIAMNSGNSSSNQPVAHVSTTSAPSSPARSTAPSSQPSTTPSSAPSTSSTSAASASTPSTPSTSPTDLKTQLSTFLTNYYGLLPGNQDQAFNSLTTDYQTNTAKGRSGYAAWWNSIDHVELKEVVAKEPNNVTGTLYYYFKNGTRTAERTAFTLVQDGTTFKIASSSVLSSQPF